MLEYEVLGFASLAVTASQFENPYSKTVKGCNFWLKLVDNDTSA